MILKPFVLSSKKKLHMLAEHLKLVPNAKSVPEGVSYDKTFLLELLVGIFAFVFIRICFLSASHFLIVNRTHCIMESSHIYTNKIFSDTPLVLSLTIWFIESGKILHKFTDENSLGEPKRGSDDANLEVVYEI